MNKENVLKAIELAESPGQCKYFYKGQPSCVVGQLFAIEGAKEEDFGEFNECSVLGLSKDLRSNLKDYPVSLLNLLQEMWDDELIGESLSERKARMVELVNNYEV